MIAKPLKDPLDMFNTRKKSDADGTQVSLMGRKHLKQVATAARKAARMRKELKATFLQGHDETAQEKHKHF